MTSPAAPRDSSPPVSWRFALTFFALYTVFAVVTPYWQLLLRLAGFAEDRIGYIFGVAEAVGLMSPFLWGWVCDHSRRRRAWLAALILGAALCFALMGWARSVPLAMLVAAGFAFFYRPIIPLTDGLVVRYLHEHGGDYGRPRAAGSIAFIVCVLLFEWVVGLGHSQTVWPIILCMAALSVFHLASVPFLPLTAREQAERAERGRARRHFRWSALLTGQFLALMAVGFLQRFAMMGYYNFFTLFVKDTFGFEKPGLLWALGPLSEFPVIFFSGWLMARLGVRNLFALGVLGAAVRLAGFAVAPAIWVVVPLQLLHSLTFGAYHTASVEYVRRLVPPDMKQTAMSVFVAGSLGTGTVAGSAVGGWLIRYHGGYRTMYGLYAGVALVATVLAMWALREPSTEEAPGQ